MHHFPHFLLGLLLQAVFVASLTLSAHAFCHHGFSRSQWSVRLCATAILACWLYSAIFSLLMTCRWFAPVPAALAGLACLFLTAIGRPGLATHAARLTEDLARCRDLLTMRPPWLPKLAVAVFLLLASILFLRSLALPLLGWDSLTYHGVKAGMWVQQGGWKSFDAPGGWEYYKTFLGGGEACTAGAMLFLHSDLCAGMPDFFFWLMLGLVAAGLAKELGLPAGIALLVAMAFVCSLDFTRMVGTGYVDNGTNAFLLAGMWFLLRFARTTAAPDAFVAAAAFGLSASVKINAFLIGGVMLAIAIGMVAKSRRQSLKNGTAILLLFAVPVVPWLVFNTLTSGYPLGCTPLGAGPIQLGRIPPNLAWFLDRPDLNPYHFRAEASALLRALRPFVVSLALVLLGFTGLCGGLKTHQPRLLLVVAFVGATMVLYYAPSFATIRLGWAAVNGRFLAAALFLTAAAGLPWWTRGTGGTRLIKVVATIAMLAGSYTYVATCFFGRHRAESILLGLAGVSLVCLILAARTAGPATVAGKSLAATLAAVLLVALAEVAHRFKDTFRAILYSECYTMDDFPKYWLPGLMAMESDRTPAKIAIAYGPEIISHNAFAFPFLGGDLRNQLVYVSPYASGCVVPHHPDHLATATLSFEKWLEGLTRVGASHVLCFRPRYEELRWAQAHPELFRPLAGIRDEWGLFRIQSAPAPPPAASDAGGHPPGGSGTMISSDHP